MAAANYTVTATSGNTTVVPNANITVTKADGVATIKIDPIAAGYADVTVTITKSPNTETRIIRYAASAASTTPSSTWWHTNVSDASGAIPQDADNMIMIDDEVDRLYVYSRYHSGLPLAYFDFNSGNQLNFTDYDNTDGRWRESDLEAIAKSPTISSRFYCIGSMGNGNGGGSKPDRDRLIAINATGTGASTSFTYIGYTQLRNYLIAWGDTYGYDFSGSANSSIDPKTINGFNIEAMTFALNGTTLYIGFRAPLLPTSNRTKAVIAPLLNFETWFNNGSPSGAPSFGAPILFDFGGRSFRDMIHRQYDNSYIIVAGDYGGTSNGVLYGWDGNPSDAPYLLSTTDISALNVEGVMEVTVSGSLSSTKLQLMSDLGSSKFYNTNVEAKDLTYNNHKKFRTDLITFVSSVLPVNVISFTAQKQDAHVLVKWQTANEENIDHFEIEKKTGTGNFKMLQQVSSLGNGSNTYQLVDLQPETGYNYYRMKIVNNDNNIKYSSIAAIKYDKTTGLLLSIYPNPVSDIMKINSSGENISYIIYNGLGQPVMSGMLLQGLNIVNLKALSNGNYYLKTIGGNTFRFNVVR